MSGQRRYVARPRHELQQSCQSDRCKTRTRSQARGGKSEDSHTSRTGWLANNVTSLYTTSWGAPTRYRRRYLHMLTVGASCQLPFRWIVLQSSLGHKLMFWLSGDCTVGIMLTIRGNFLGECSKQSGYFVDGEKRVWRVYDTGYIIYYFDFMDKYDYHFIYWH